MYTDLLFLVYIYSVPTTRPPLLLLFFGGSRKKHIGYAVPPFTLNRNLPNYNDRSHDLHVPVCLCMFIICRSDK